MRTASYYQVRNTSYLIHFAAEGMHADLSLMQRILGIPQQVVRGVFGPPKRKSRNPIIMTLIKQLKKPLEYKLQMKSPNYRWAAAVCTELFNKLFTI